MKRFLLPAISILVILTACTEKKHLKCDCQCEAAEEDQATFTMKPVTNCNGEECQDPPKKAFTAKFKYGQKVKLTEKSIYENCTGTVEEALPTLGEYEIEIWSCPHRKDMDYISKKVFVKEENLGGLK